MTFHRARWHTLHLLTLCALWPAAALPSLAQPAFFDPQVAARFEKAYPELANADGVDATTFDALPEADIERVARSALVALPFGRARAIRVANHYVLYTAPCAPTSAPDAMCHYLEVAAGFSRAIHRWYGPIALPPPPPPDLEQEDRHVPLPRRETDLKEMN